VRADIQRQRAAMIQQRLQNEQQQAQFQQQQWRAQREQQLAQRQQQNPQAQHQQLTQHIGSMRNAEFLRAGILSPQSSPAYVEAVNQRFDAAMGQLVAIASRDRARNPQAEPEPLESLVAKAVQIVGEHVGEAPRTQQPVQQAAPQQHGLSPRPAGAPTTTGAGTQGPMSPRQMEQFIRGGRK
jgi:hypothetical protein